MEDKILIKKIAKMLQDDWTGKKGFWTDNEMFKYCEWYTGNQPNFWNKGKLKFS